MKRDRDFVVGFLLGLLLGILGMAGAAKAAPFTPELEADYAYAEQWWGATPTGCSSVEREVTTIAALGEGAVGRATMPEAGMPLVPCVMRIAAEQVSPCTLREVVLHEYGHLLGYDHSADPASVMYPTLSGGLCAEEWRADSALAEAARVRRMIARTNARCQVKPTRLQRKMCRQTEREYRRILAAALAATGA